jgi:hypothetical protein
MREPSTMCRVLLLPESVPRLGWRMSLIRSRREPPNGLGSIRALSASGRAATLRVSQQMATPCSRNYTSEMVGTAFSKILGTFAVASGVFLLMFNDLGQPTWIMSAAILVACGGWLLMRRTSKDDDWPPG